MRHILCYATTWILISTALYGADTIGDIYGSQQLVQPDKLQPFQIKGAYDYIGRSNFSESDFKCQDIRFGQGGAEGRWVCRYNAHCDEGLSLTVGYTNTYLGWKENPFFDQEHFNTLSFAVGGFSQRVPCWLWQGQVTMNISTDDMDFNHYTTWDLLLWGRYTYNCKIGIHAGFLAQTGMMLDRYYPIFGFDWQINCKWKLNVIFPVNISMEYLYDKCWTFSLAGRFFDTRYRAGMDEVLPMAIFEYRAVGVEFAADYDYCDWIHFNAHAGGTAGGKLKISNRHHHDGKYFRFEPAPYAGGVVTIRF